jgi:hypothetical protein
MTNQPGEPRKMRDLNQLEYHPKQEKVVDILKDQVQNSDSTFFRLMVSYYFNKLASMMRTNVSIPGRGVIPVNMYCINLAVSGSGKGHSINIIEDQVIHKFRERFLEETFVIKKDESLAKLAVRRANKKGTDPDNEQELLDKEFDEAGEMVFSFDSATTPAVKQMRHKLLMANAGSMNMELDEVGHNLLGNIDVLTTFLELFDLGKTKQKLVKSTKENQRQSTLFGSTPTNMLLFGTPTKLLNGGKEEDGFYEMLETGYARRCFFGYSRNRASSVTNYTADEIYDIFNDVSSANYLAQLADELAQLADPVNFGSTLTMNEDVAKEWINYRLHCEREAQRLSEYEEIRKAELMHRHFKVIKLAGAYAFVDNAMCITEDHLYNAVAMAEESGEAVTSILNRDRPYVKLASYICSIGKEVTHADLIEDLPFYKGSEAQKREMLTLAIAHGYKNNMVIKKEEIDGIDFFSGSSLAETDLASLIVSHSDDITTGYVNADVKFNQLQIFGKEGGHHWVNHHLHNEQNKGGYRDETHCKPGFNLIVLDVDGGTPIQTAQLLLEDYTYIIHTTKSHTAKSHRYRIIMPISHVIELNGEEYKAFMRSVFEWLPFEVDTQIHRVKKWESCKGVVYQNQGNVLDALQFIPKTKKSEEAKVKLAAQGNMTALERWFVNNIEVGNRNNMLLRYAYACIDMGQDDNTIRNNVLGLNAKLAEPLDEHEVITTVLMSASRKLASKTP